jgi:ABC-2 type transport system permease protein
MLSVLRALGSGIGREWRLIRRHPSVLVVLLGLPVIYPVVVSALYARNQADERPALWVDADNSAASRALARDVDATQMIEIVGRPATLADGFAALRGQDVEMLIYVPDGFSRRLKRGEQAHLQVWASSVNVYTYGLSYPALYDVVLAHNGDLARRFLAAKGVAPEVARNRVPAVVASDRLLFQPTGAYGPFLVPGILLVVAQQVVLISLAFSIGWQRQEEGPPDDARRLPFLELVGRGLGHFSFYLLGNAFMVFAIPPLFGWSMQSAGWVFAIFAALALGTLPAALLVANLTRDRFIAFQLMMFFSAPLFLMSGFSFPLSQMPTYVQALAWLFPITPALEALRALSVKGTAPAAALGPTLGTMSVQLCLWTLAALSSVYLVRWLRRRSVPVVALPSVEVSP